MSSCLPSNSGVSTLLSSHAMRPGYPTHWAWQPWLSQPCWQVRCQQFPSSRAGATPMTNTHDQQRSPLFVHRCPGPNFPQVHVLGHTSEPEKVNGIKNHRWIAPVLMPYPAAPTRNSFATSSSYSTRASLQNLKLLNFTRYNSERVTFMHFSCENFHKLFPKKRY